VHRGNSRWPIIAFSPKTPVIMGVAQPMREAKL